MLLSVTFLVLLPLLSSVKSQSTDWQLKFVNKSPYRNMFKRTYTAFTCWLDCEQKATIICYYTGTKDSGIAPRPTGFKLDPLVNRTCQQFSTISYSSEYDRGHMVAANHMDMDSTTIAESMYMTNIMPQTTVLNRQAWLHAEEIFDCYSDIINLKTIVGIIMGNSNDLFLKSHGVRTPEFFWRVIVKDDGDVIAWIMPNDKTATKNNIDSFLTSISEIEKRTGFKFSEFSTKQRNFVAHTSWSLPQSCNKS